MRKFARVLALLIVGASSVLGLVNLPDEFRTPGDTLLQRSVAFGSALHSVLGLIVVLGVLRRKRWAVPAAIAWTISVTYTASVASVAWESLREPGVLVGGFAAGLSCALLGWWLVWAARDSVRPHIPATSETFSPPR